MCIHKCTAYKYKNRNATLYRCTTLNFDNLLELGNRQNFKVFCFSTIIEKIQWRVRNVRNIQKCMYYVSEYLQTWTTEPGDQSVHQLIAVKDGKRPQGQDTSWHCTMLYNALHKEKYKTNLHQTPSSYKRFPIQRSSPDHSQQQLLRHSPWAASAFWCRVPRRCHASFGRTRGVAPRPLHKNFRNQTATATATSHYTIGSLCRNSVSSNLIGKKWKKSRQNCFASSMLPMLLAYDGITNLKGNKQVLHIHTSTACLLSTICSDGSLQNTKTPHKKTVGKKRKHCTYCTTTSSNDVLSILAMLHFGGKGGCELTLSYAISLWESVPETGSILSHFQATFDICKFAT